MGLPTLAGPVVVMRWRPMVPQGATPLAAWPAHIFVSMLDPKSPLMAKMLREISDYNLYKQVVNDYSEIYNGDENKLRLEAVGKLIGNIIVNDFTGETQANIDRVKGWWARLWEVIKRILSKVGIGEIEEYTTNSPTVFQQFARDIIDKKPSRTLSDVLINNNFESIVMQLEKKKYLTKICP
jgi:hypothetical protein